MEACCSTIKILKKRRTASDFVRTLKKYVISYFNTVMRTNF